MERDLISKKELLDVTGISYGQLYRWKRKQLIPEEWFIRKSAFTGQETFFPRDLILARIDKILNMKEDVSLDELAGKLGGQVIDLEWRKKLFVARNIVSEMVVRRYMGSDPDDRLYGFEQMLFFYTLDVMLRTGEMSVEEGDVLLRTLEEHFAKFNGSPCDLIFIRRMGLSSFLLVASAAPVYFDSGVRVAARLAMPDLIETLKGKLV